METIEYRTFDKSNWGAGEWQGEPDKKQWLDPETEYPCLIVRNHGGALCGYVGVSKDHPFYGSDYDGVDVEVHGRLTFADKCASDGDESLHICHRAPGDDSVWWFGFDCAHYNDVSPANVLHKGLGIVSLRDGQASYKDFDYVTKEVTALARQLKNLEAA